MKGINEVALTDLNFDRLKINILTDAQLVTLIRLAQQELDERYPIQVPQNLQCPSCGQTEENFWTSCRYVAVVCLDDAYVPTDTDSSPTWGPEYGCRCSACFHDGLLIEFIPSAKWSSGNDGLESV